jgi:hypothetical protein
MDEMEVAGEDLSGPAMRLSLHSACRHTAAWQAVCAEVSAELKASVDAYTHDMDVGVLVYERLMAHPQASQNRDRVPSRVGEG